MEQQGLWYVDDRLSIGVLGDIVMLHAESYFVLEAFLV